MDEQQIRALVVDEVDRALVDVRERLGHLERLAADRTHPVVAEAAAVVDAELVALARTADLSADG